MLPGFRFLFAAIVLTVSLVVFGLGAAALLRSAHQEFATIPSSRPPPTAFLIQQPIEAAPTLAMLRLEPRMPDVAPAPALPVTATAEQAPVALPPEPENTAAPETVAALSAPTIATIETPAPVDAPKAEVPLLPEAAKIETPAPVTVAVAPTASVEPIATPVPEIATTTPIPPPESITAPPQQTATLTDDDAKLSSTKIAMLGGPPVDTEPVPLPKAKPAVEPVKKVVKNSPVKKRRVAARPVAAAAAAPLPVDPFGLPVAR